MKKFFLLAAVLTATMLLGVTLCMAAENPVKLRLHLLIICLMIFFFFVMKAM